MGEPSNSGFEPETAPVVQAENSSGSAAASEPAGQVKGGWKVAGAAGSKIEIDAANPHSGQGCLKLTAPAGSVSVMSGDFIPSSGFTMTIQAYLRAEPADSLVRLWVQGEVSGQPYLRRAEFNVGSTWELKAVRATSLPAGGLDSARSAVRDPEPGLALDRRPSSDWRRHAQGGALNAQRTLWAALQAYRSQHYAEFARLSSSHWARHPSILAASRSPRAGELAEPTGPAQPGPAEAALSPDRRLR